MPARTGKIKLTEPWRDKIKASLIINRLAQHFEGKLELSKSQIDVAKILLAKVVPDLNRTTIEGDPDKPLQSKITVEVIK